jgi:transcriptional regulator with XRE-family HTH domain
MDKLSLQKQMLIIRLYLNGLSYDEIAVKAGVAKGSVANVISQLKAGQVPGIYEVPDLLDTLRQIAIDMNKLKATPAELFEGASTLPLLRELDIEPGEIKSWASMCKQWASDTNPQNFVRAALYLDKLHRSTGQTPQALEQKVQHLREEEAKLEPVTVELKDKENVLQGLNETIKKANADISQREKRLDLVNKEVAQKEKRDMDLSRRITAAEEKALRAEERLSIANKSLADLTKIGLTAEDFPGFAQRVAHVAHRHSIAPSVLRDRLLSELEQLDAELGIESLVKDRKHELVKIDQDIAKRLQERSALNHTLELMHQEKETLRIAMAEEQEVIRKEFEATARIAKEAVADFRSQLLQGIGDALQDIQKLRDHALEVGQEAGRLQGAIEVNEWLRTLLALIKGDTKVQAIDVRSIIIAVLRGTRIWIQDNPAKISNSHSVILKINAMTEELEQWKI